MPRTTAAVFKSAMTASAALALAGCATQSVTDFADAPRTLVLEDYFLGETTAYGVFEDRFGTVRRQFKVDITGTVEDGVLTLDERFFYDDGARETRVWTIEILGDGRYRGTANDVPGYAEGEVSGNAFNWKYKVDLNVGGDVWNVGFDDWMFLLPDGVLINRAYVTRWGIRIGEVSITFVRNDEPVMMNAAP